MRISQLIVVIVFLAAACSPQDQIVGRDENAGKSGGKLTPRQEVGGRPVAKIGDRVITDREFTDALGAQDPFVQMRFSSPERKRDFLKVLVQAEVLAQEARRLKLDTDPAVVAEMRKALAERMRKELETSLVKPEDVKDEDVQRFYQEHKQLFVQTDRVKVTRMTFATEKDADSAKVQLSQVPLAARAKYVPTIKVVKATTELGFLTASEKAISEDEARLNLPTNARLAAGALKAEGELSPVLPVGQEYWLFLCDGLQVGAKKTYEEVKEDVKNRMYQDRRHKAMEDYLKDLEAKAKIEIYDENLKNAASSAKKKAG